MDGIGNEAGAARKAAYDAPFISAAARGADWREAAAAVAAQWEGREDALRACTLGFLYVTDSLAEEMEPILDFLRTVTGIAHWVGAVGVGVLATGASYIDEPAIAVMAGAFDSEKFCIFPAVDLDLSPALAVLKPWLARNEPLLVLLHGDPLSDNDPAHSLAELALEVGGFTAGGLASARGRHVQVAEQVTEGGLSGVAFAADIEVSTTVSQGCTPLGGVHRITACRENLVLALDGRPAYEVFAAAVRAAGAPAGGGTPGDVHVAFPVPGRDQKDYLVRHALGLDPDGGWIAVAGPVHEGGSLMFVHRDEQSLRADLSRALVALRRRVTRDKGVFAPRGAVYVSCVARAQGDFWVPDVGMSPLVGRGAEEAASGEMALVREILGDIPLAGFYANGEIANGCLYGYTAVVILFL